MTSVDHEVVGLEGRGMGLVIVGLVFAATAAATVAGRILSRVTTKRMLGNDDYIMVASLVFSIGFTIITCLGVSYGYGHPDKTLTKEQLQSALKAFFACQIAYKITLNLTKFSILFLYLRIFPNHWFRLCVKWITASLIVFALASIFATIFQCSPVARNWDHTIPGECFGLVKFWYFNASISIFSDLVILLLPMPLIGALQLPRTQKLGLMMIFGLGGFVCITSVVRMTVLKTGAVSSDVSHGTLKSTIWTAVECNTAIICASLPMLKTTMAKLFPKFFPRSQASTTQVDDDDDCQSPSRPTSQVNELWGATTFPAAWRYKHDPTGFKLWMEAEGYSKDIDIPLSDLNQKIPKVYCPKGISHPIDVITKTTDIRVQYTRKEEEDSSSTDSVFHIGNEVVIVPGQSRKSLPYRR